MWREHVSAISTDGCAANVSRGPFVRSARLGKTADDNRAGFIAF